MGQNSQRLSIESVPSQVDSLLKECPALAEAARYGVDIPLLLDNLHRSVSRRIHRHQAALNAMNQLRNARPL